MQRWRGLDAVPSGWGRSVVIVGVFAGVHRGHQPLLGAAVAAGRARGLPTALVTFDPHPAEVVRPGSHPARRTRRPPRADPAAERGVDAFLVLPFTAERARRAPAEFAHEVLVDRLHAAVVVVGANFTFGYRAAGTVAVLAELGTRFGFAVEGIALATDGAGDHVTFSSTYIRACIDAGDVEAAAAARGRPHRGEGVVVHGHRRGRALGFPTANVATPPYTALPADGVYAGRFVLGDRRLPAAVSVGSNPTFSGTVRPVEAYVLDVDEDFYGHEVGVDFVARLRGQERYDDLDALVAAIRGDVARTRALLEA